MRTDLKENINKTIYLFDKVEGTYSDFATPIELTLPRGTYSDRFFITFQQTALDVKDNVLTSNQLSVFSDTTTNELVIKNNNNLDIQKVAIYTILGQEIKSWKNLEKLSENRLKINNLSSAIYIVKITTDKGNLNKKIYLKN